MSVLGELFTDYTLRTLNGVNDVTRCSQTRDIFTDAEVQAAGNQTRWQLKYLQWYFSQNVNVDHDGDGETILTEIRYEVQARSQCVLDADPDKLPYHFKYFRRARVSAAKEILRLRSLLNDLLIKHTGLSEEEIERYTDRDFFMTAEQAVDYGLIDQVLAAGAEEA